MPKCTECGKEFNFLLGQVGNYAYKQNTASSNDIVETKYQCSYTCWNHAKLRTKKERRHTKASNWIRDVKISEEVMTAQGKEILHPIKY